MPGGWYQVAYERDLTEEVTPARIRDLHLALVRRGDEVRAIDAYCPHRGAHLGFGGRVDRGAVVCPFHARRVALEPGGEGDYCARQYPALVAGGLVFVRPSEHDAGFERFLREREATHCFVPGWVLLAEAPATLVIENAFDNTHFRPVHAIRNEPAFAIAAEEGGAFTVRGTFAVPPSPWQRGGASPGSEAEVLVPFTARAFSPGIVVSDMGGEHPYSVITTATPLTEGQCVVRLSLAIPLDAEGRPPAEAACRYLLEQSRAGVEKDHEIWRAMRHDAAPLWAEGDEAVRAFRAFCARFEEAA